MAFKILSEVEHTHTRPEILVGTIQSLNRSFDIFNDQTKEYETLNFNFSEGFFRLFEEAVTNSVDEFDRSGLVKNISIEVKDGYISVYDDGSGFPIQKHEFDGEEKWIPEWIFTKLYSGTNFSDDNRTTVGMNGVGISIVNFFSSRFEFVSKQLNSKKYTQIFEQHSTKVFEPELKNSKTSHFSQIKFFPDMSLFPDLDVNVFDYYMPIFIEYVRKLAMIYPSIKFTFNDEIIKFTKKEFFEGALNEHIIKWDKSNNFAFGLSNHHAVSNQRIIHMINSKPIEYFVDFTTFKNAIFNEIREALNKKYKLKLTRNTWFSENISVVALFKGTNAKFKNQTKDILVSYDSDEFDFKKANISWWAKQFLNDEVIINKFLEYYHNNLKSVVKKKIKKLKNVYIQKLVEATNKNPEEKILIITEGDSATGGFNVVRDPSIHSLLPVKGKTMNIAFKSLASAMKNEIYKNIISAIQLGTPENLRHGKVYIATDSDEDGLHIRILLIQFFAKFFPWFIEQGRLYIIVAPRYKYDINGKSIYSIVEPPAKAKNIKYYKGLGSNDKTANKAMLINPTLIEVEDIERIKEFYKRIYG